MTAGGAYKLSRLPPWATGVGLTVVQAALVGTVSGFVPCAGYLPAHAASLGAESAARASLQLTRSGAVLWSLRVPSTALQGKPTHLSQGSCTLSGGTWEACFGGSVGLEGVARGAGRRGAGGGRKPSAAHLRVGGLLADRDVLRAAHGLRGQVGGHGGRRGRK